MKKVNNKEKLAPTKKEKPEQKEEETLKVSHIEEEVELSDDDKAKAIFSQHPHVLAKYRYIRKFSTVKHDPLIAHLKKLYKIK